MKGRDSKKEKPEVRRSANSAGAESIELIRSGKAGDRAAVNEFLRRYHPRLLRVVRIRMGTFLRRHVDPEDIVQETFIIAVEKLPQLQAEAGSNFLCWLTRISDHVASNQRVRLQAQKRDPGKERRLRSADPPSMAGSGIILSDGRPTPSQEFSRRELEERVDTCVQELEPEAYRQVILMRDYMEADWDTICEDLKRPSVDSARELHRRARVKLRESLGQLDLD